MQERRSQYEVCFPCKGGVMIFRQLVDDKTWTYSYLLADKRSGEAIMIDPVLSKFERDMQLIDELNLHLLYAVDTHVHADHISANGRLRKQTGCQIGIAAKESVNCVDLHLKEGDVLSFGQWHLKVIETPGHTAGCLSFVCEDKVFTGDALMIRGCGRTDFQQGDATALYHSITSKLYKLSDYTLVFPGHDYKGLTVSTILEEKMYNPRVLLGQDGFVEFMSNIDLPSPKKIHEAVPCNQQCGMPVEKN